MLCKYSGWIADYITDRTCGCVVPPNDASAFADAVEWMMTHRDELPAMGAAARQLAEDTFARDLLGTQFVDVLTQFAQ